MTGRQSGKKAIRTDITQYHARSPYQKAMTFSDAVYPLSRWRGQLWKSKVSIETLANDLQEFGQNLDPMDIPGIAKLLELLVERMEVDLETREVEIVFALPSWMAQACNSSPQVGLDALSVYRPIIETHPENSVILAVFACRKEEVPRHGCFKCRRLPLAA